MDGRSAILSECPTVCKFWRSAAAGSGKAFCFGSSQLKLLQNTNPLSTVEMHYSRATTCSLNIRDDTNHRRHHGMALLPYDHR